MLAMVTTDFYNCSRVGMYLFQALGLEWDAMASWSKDLNFEIFPQTCTWSIGIWESLYGIESDESFSLEVRRKKVLEKVLYQAPISPQALEGMLYFCTGADEVVVRDFTAPYSFEVSIKYQGEISNMIDIWEFIYRVKPSHLSFRLFFEKQMFVDHELHTGLHYGLYRSLSELNLDEENLVISTRSSESVENIMENNVENSFSYSRKELADLLKKKRRLQRRGKILFSDRVVGSQVTEITFKDVLRSKEIK